MAAQNALRSDTTQPSRIQQARGRLEAARRGVVVGALSCFGLLLLVVRASHPAHATTAAQLSAPSSLIAQVQSSSNFGGGSISGANGPASASTSTS